MSKILITGSSKYHNYQYIETLLLCYLKSLKNSNESFTIISRPNKSGLDLIANQLANKYKSELYVFYEDKHYCKTIANCDYAIIAEINDDQEDIIKELSKHKKPFYLIKVKSD